MTSSWLHLKIFFFLWHVKNCCLLFLSTLFQINPRLHSIVSSFWKISPGQNRQRRTEILDLSHTRIEFSLEGVRCNRLRFNWDFDSPTINWNQFSRVFGCSIFQWCNARDCHWISFEKVCELLFEFFQHYWIYLTALQRSLEVISQ